MEFFSAPIAIGFILSYIVSGSVLSIYEVNFQVHWSDLDLDDHRIENIR